MGARSRQHAAQYAVRVGGLLTGCVGLWISVSPGESRGRLVAVNLLVVVCGRIARQCVSVLWPRRPGCFGLEERGRDGCVCGGFRGQVGERAGVMDGQETERNNGRPQVAE